MADPPSAARPQRTPEEELIPYRASTFSARRVLVLAPHPDDEVFGCGAALASLSESGADVTVYLVTDGAGSEPDHARRREIGERRAAESRQALQHIGITKVRQGGFYDRNLLVDPGRLAEEFERLIREIRPDLVFLPSPAEVHPDHRAVAQAFLSVVRGLPEADTLEALPEAHLAFFEISQPIRPNFLLDATPYQEKKEQAMQAYVSQIGGKDYPSLVLALTTYRRMTLGPHVRFAEGYFVLPVSVCRVVPAERILRVLGPSLSPAELGEVRSLENERIWVKAAAFLRTLLGR